MLDTDQVPRRQVAHSANRSPFPSQNARSADAPDGAAALNAKESDYAIS
ncbi:hypothetical protein [Comamonas piscis]